jgi:hypothetical protein
MVPNPTEANYLDLLSTLTLSPWRAPEAMESVAHLSPEQRNELALHAERNHVVLRAFMPLRESASRKGETQTGVWCNEKIEHEQARISLALSYLVQVTTELEFGGCSATVMKSLDHWPDLGNDLDLYTSGSAERVREIMVRRFNASVEPRSWGDRLANKWNFAIPGLPELIEVHANRLGQTGEHTLMAERFITRRVAKTVAGVTFNVPAPEERIVVATLQRMYRHFYFRICDMVNTVALVESGELDYSELRKAAQIGGIWKGVCTFLRIASEYRLRYTGSPLPLPKEVLAEATMGADKLTVSSGFIRIPIVPDGANLYGTQLLQTAMRGDVAATARLSLFPYLASAAAISYKLTGSDKGIW